MNVSSGSKLHVLLTKAGAIQLPKSVTAPLSAVGTLQGSSRVIINHDCTHRLELRNPEQHCRALLGIERL
jgi:hypothetical protein